jgi:aspartyl-tRNA(Asn)/glutamyl-tRNA(Gln) amidotransferase subunit C
VLFAHKKSCRPSKILGDLAAKLYFCSMVKITDQLIDDLAHLSRLSFDAQEKEAIKSDMEQMVLFVEKLSEVDTTGVAPLLHITPNQNVFREDAVEGSISRDEALKNVPKTDGTYILVPKVIKK